MPCHQSRRSTTKPELFSTRLVTLRREHGVQTNTWYHLLRPIIFRFVAAYDNPNAPENLDFWGKVAHETGGGSGPTWLSGWITAFCVFDEQGRWQGNKLTGEQHGSTPYLTLDGFPYPRIDTNDIPCGYTCVDVKLDDNGALFDTMFIAGLVGLQISTAEQTKPRSKSARNAVRPLPAWWYFVKKDMFKAADDEDTTQASSLSSETTNEATRNRHSFHQDITSRVKGVWDALRRK